MGFHLLELTIVCGRPWSFVFFKPVLQWLILVRCGGGGGYGAGNRHPLVSDDRLHMHVERHGPGYNPMTTHPDPPLTIIEMMTQVSTIFSKLCLYKAFKGCASGHSLHCPHPSGTVHFVSSVLRTMEAIDELTLNQVIITPTNASQELIELLCGFLEKDPAISLG